MNNKVPFLTDACIDNIDNICIRYIYSCDNGPTSEDDRNIESKSVDLTFTFFTDSKIGRAVDVDTGLLIFHKFMENLIKGNITKLNIESFKDVIQPNSSAYIDININFKDNNSFAAKGICYTIFVDGYSNCVNTDAYVLIGIEHCRNNPIPTDLSKYPWFDKMVSNLFKHVKINATIDDRIDDIVKSIDDAINEAPDAFVYLVECSGNLSEIMCSLKNKLNSKTIHNIIFC